MFKVKPKIIRAKSRRQRTLAQEVVVSGGFGLWTGQDVTYSFRPAPENSGIRFVRDDLRGKPSVYVHVDNRVDNQRQTSLAMGESRVDMVEHVLAALRAMRVDNCEIIATAQEAPGFDGSAAPFMQAFLEVGTVAQEAPRDVFRIVEPGEALFDNGSSGSSSIKLLVDESRENRCVFKYTLYYDVFRGIPNQEALFDLNRSSKDYGEEIAPCRTFLTYEEALALQNSGICQKATTQNALVFDENGVRDNSLRFENECARHKLIDMTGDFALLPVDWIGEFHAFRTGHKQNALLMEGLWNLVRES